MSIKHRVLIDSRMAGCPAMAPVRTSLSPRDYPTEYG